MIVLLIILALICIWRLDISGYHEDYMVPKYTTAIKGIFTVLIFYSHIRGYLSLSDHWSNSLYSTVFDYLGQLIVVMFFFYSGFGVWESQKKKSDYANTFFKRRILKTLLHFDIAILLFIVVQVFLPIHYTTKDYLLCWIGWTSVGNSNWFIFVILGLYLIALLSLFFQKNFGQGGILLTAVLSACFWIWLRIIMRQPNWWVDTLAAFPLGMAFSQYKPALDQWLEKKSYHPVLAVLLSAIAFLIAYKLVKIDIYGGVSCLFCSLTALFSSFVKIGNPILDWLGKNAFTIYIIQRLPMIVFSQLGINQYTALYIVLVLTTTLLLAEGLSWLYAVTDKRLFAHA